MNHAEAFHSTSCHLEGPLWMHPGPKLGVWAASMQVPGVQGWQWQWYVQVAHLAHWVPQQNALKHPCTHGVGARHLHRGPGAGRQANPNFASWEEPAQHHVIPRGGLHGKLFLDLGQVTKHFSNTNVPCLSLIACHANCHGKVDESLRVMSWSLRHVCHSMVHDVARWCYDAWARLSN